MYFTDIALVASAPSLDIPSYLVGDLGDNELRADARLVDTDGDGTGDSTLVTLLYDADSSADSIEYSYRQLYLDGDVTDTVLSGGEFNYEALVLNAQPVITSTAVTTVDEDSAYSYALTATDAEGTDVTLSVTVDGVAIAEDSWLSFSNNTISGTPLNDDVGTYAVVVTAEDEDGQSSEQSFTLTVANTNDAPEISVTPVTTASQGAEYSVNFSVADVDVGDETDGTITVNGSDITADDYDGWLSLAENEDGSFTISGTPTITEAGTTQSIVITATDGEASDTESFDIAVSSPTEFFSFGVTANGPGTAHYLTIYVDVDKALAEVDNPTTYNYLQGGSFTFKNSDGSAFSSDLFAGGVGLGVTNTYYDSSPFGTASYSVTSGSDTGFGKLVLANTSGVSDWDTLQDMDANDGSHNGKLAAAKLTFVEDQYQALVDAGDGFTMQVSGTFAVGDLAADPTDSVYFDQVAVNYDVI
jgi:hypothetical protein